MYESIDDLMPKKIYARALDPIHIGAGGYRLGRVDNTIVRDPATNVPKIPGTSIAGIVRAYAEIVKEENKEGSDADKKPENVNIEDVFGTETKKGILRFYDGQILFFPVSSVQGTVWITTKELIEYWFIEYWFEDKDGEKIKIPDEITDKAYAIKGIDISKPLNLGWLLLEVEGVNKEKEIVLPLGVGRWVKRIVVVSDKLFSHIVNDNLEVRTSVRIDPSTGTAAEGALFTYEAIPRGTVFGFEIGVDKTMARQRSRGNNVVDEIIRAVTPYIKNLGIGGMGTRGFGRLELLLGSLSDTNTEEGGINA
ncbi:MAG: CRISPR-associated protein Cmr4 [bacterium]|nr:CRISPR-associated protein Cmr4 [bacterium]